MISVNEKVRQIKELIKCEVEIKTKKFSEAFMSLRTELEKAVSYKFGRDAFAHDFSPKEVVVGFHSSNSRPLSSWESGEYEKTDYKMDGKGVVTFSGPISKVSKKVTFEHNDPREWLLFKTIEDSLNKEMIKMKKISAILKIKK